MNAAFFKNLPAHLSEYIGQARVRLRIAVCWFSHRDLFDMLIKKLREGLRIELLLEYDNQNIRDGGLDFQAFIRAGGVLFVRTEPGLMHHKFAIVDHAVLLTGSFNWTYNVNAENLLATEDPLLIAEFDAEFERQIARARRISQVNRDEIRVFSAFPLLENTCHNLPALRRSISTGLNVWVVRLEKCGAAAPSIFRENMLPFDRNGLLLPFWGDFRAWDEVQFKTRFAALTAKASPGAAQDLWRWAKRIQTGDLVFVTLGRQQFVGLGIVQSAPRPGPFFGFSTCRDVQWLRRPGEKSGYFFTEKLPAAGLARFRGSAMKVVQEVMG